MQIISVVIHFPDSPRPIFAVPFHALRVKCIYLFTARNDSPSRYYQFQPRNNHVAGKRGRREGEGGSGVSETKLSDLFLTDTMTSSSRESTKVLVPFLLGESSHDRSKPRPPPRIFQRNSCACTGALLIQYRAYQLLLPPHTYR